MLHNFKICCNNKKTKLWDLNESQISIWNLIWKLSQIEADSSVFQMSYVNYIYCICHLYELIILTSHMSNVITYDIL